MDTSLVGFIILSTVICAAPGPTMFFVISLGLTKNRLHAITAVLSITAANLIWVVLSATGLAALIHSSVTAFETLKIAGALYLIYLGILTWRSGLSSNSNSGPETSMTTIFIRGLVTSLSNPKALIFYISFLPQFVDGESPFLHQAYILGGSYIMVVFVVMSLYALLANHMASIFKKGLFKQVATKALGCAFIISGLSLLKR